MKKTADGKRKGTEYTDPADFSSSKHRAQAKIYAYGNGYGQQRENELAEREPEEQAFLIVSDFFVDAYLDWISPPFLILDFRQTGTCHVCRGMLTSN